MKTNMSINAKLILLGLALYAAAVPAQAQITFRAAGVQTVGTGTSITPTIPAGTQAGDLAVLIISGRPTNMTQPAAPAGWTLRSSSLREVGAKDLKIMTFYRVLTGGDTNPTVNLPTAWQGTSAGMSGQIAVWRGMSTTTPFDVADVTGNSASVASWTPPTITTVTPGAWVVSAVAASDDNALAILTAQGFTGRMTGASYDTTTGGDHSVGLADKVQATAGTPTMLTWSQATNASDPWAAITFALRPNAAPSVNLTSPANGATFTAPASITLTASTTDADGTIQKVEFFHGGINLIATVVAAPYTFNWTNVAAASYTLTAKATDNLNATTTSAPVNITVNAAVAQLYFIYTDHLNTPRVITNQAAQVVWRWDQTDPFGGNPPDENPSGLGTFTCNLRLPGQYFDKETNLHYNYFRDYDSGIGRYIQSDPIGLQGGINTYAYVMNNPLSFADYFGLEVTLWARPADIGPSGIVGKVVDHQWIRTDKYEAGMGPANGQVPAQEGRSDYFGVPVKTVDHTGQSKAADAKRVPISFPVDEMCVNHYIQPGKPLGRFMPANTCQTFADDVLDKCRIDPRLGRPKSWTSGTISR